MPVATSDQPLMCTPGLSAGNPIIPALGSKMQTETDLRIDGPHPIAFTRTYRSDERGADFSPGWSHPFRWTISLDGADALVLGPQGEAWRFRQTSPTSAVSAWSPVGHHGGLTQDVSGWRFSRSDGSQMVFNPQRLLTDWSELHGWTTHFEWDASQRVTRVRNAFGRGFTLGYEGQQLTSVSADDGRTLRYGYDSLGRLTSVIYPDQTQRSFLYEDVGRLHALTGIVDEKGQRFATFGYDPWGRANSSEHAGGVLRYLVNYPQSVTFAIRTATVTDPLGTWRRYDYDHPKGKLAVTGSDRPANEPSPNDAARREIDDQGRPIRETDFAGIVRTTSWNDRNLPLVVTEAEGTPQARTTRTSWHARFALPLTIERPGERLAFSYDDRGNLLSERRTDNRDASVRTTRYEWDARSLLTRQVDADGQATRFAYDDAGRLVTRTDALNRSETFSYDAAGHLQTATDPAGNVTRYRWDARDRLTRIEQAGRIITLTYDPNGQLVPLPLPTGLVIDYDYDAAHRLIGWKNNRSESARFTLDGMGSWEVEYDATGRITSWREPSPAGASRSYSYDTNGNRLQGREQRGSRLTTRQSTMQARSNRLAGFTQKIELAGATSISTAAVTYTLDVAGNLLSDGLRRYSYDADNRLASVSTGAGDTTRTTRYRHDALGRRVFKTEAAFGEANAGPTPKDPVTQGIAYLYDEDDTLLAEAGTGGAASSGRTLHV